MAGPRPDPTCTPNETRVSTALDELADRYANAMSVQDDTLSYLRALNDRLFGDVPREVACDPDTPERPGKIGRLYDRADALDTTAQAIHNLAREIGEKL